MTARRDCPDCDCPASRCEGYGPGRKCCPDCKHTPESVHLKANISQKGLEGTVPLKVRGKVVGTAVVHPDGTADLTINSGSPAATVYTAPLSDLDIADAAAAALRCFGPGTTEGGRAEAGWLAAGRIVGDGPDLLPDL